ncbi:MAG: mercury(II) reductase [Chloroflexota bacterium]|nr:mercury(II) reductase [Chloroflexota bacterium]
MSNDRARLPIAGMTCSHCETAVRGALAAAGATDVRADFRRGEATFRLPEDPDPVALQTAVRDAGYRPGELERPTPIPTPITPRRATGADYDLAIVGSGSAAFAAAIKAREQDARVVMVERGTTGGTCVNIGCVPSKTLLRGAEVYHAAAHHPFRGIETQAGTVDFSAMVAQKDELVGHLRQAKYANLIDEYDWEFVRGEARFVDSTTLAVGERPIRAAHYLVAPGARPAVPPIPGLAEAGYLTSTTAMEQSTLPRSLVVIGAGYIALEQGQLFRHLGVEVTLLQRGARLLPDYEPEIGAAVGEVLARAGIPVLTGAQVERVERDGPTRRLHLEVGGQPRVLEAEQILVAAGRSPNTEALNLPATGIETDGRGAIVTDPQLRTTNPAVFAAGDVTLCPQYVYVAAYQGGVAADNALNGANRPCDLTALPGVIFTDPQVATVGVTEAQARANGVDVKTAVLPISSVPRAQVNYEDLGVFKLVADATTDRVLGAHVVAGNAGDVIYAATLAVKHGLTVADLVESFAPYLTMAEGLKLGALAFDRDVSKLSCCAA